MVYFFLTWGRGFLTGWWVLACLQDLHNLIFNQTEHVLPVGVATEYVVYEYKSKLFHVFLGSGNPENVSLLVFLKPLAGINIF